VLQRFNGELVLLDSRDSGGGGRSDYGGDEDFGGGGFSGGSSRQQARPQPATFDNDLDDDVPF